MSGFTPVQRVFGATPTEPGGVVDVSSQQSDLRDYWPQGDDGSFYADVQGRLSAAEAFFVAKASRAVMAALAARSRPLRRQFSIGEKI